ncbi:MAG: 5'-3' exonuclease [Actinomycetota bacterium]
MATRLLLDVSSLAYRAYFALRDSVRAPDGRPVGAVHGYLGMVTRLVVSRHPDEVVHVYDHDWRPTARTRLYAGYKADRPPEPEDLTPQFVLLRGVLEAMGATQAHAQDWEAEDAIGGLCARGAVGDRFEIVSGDRDLLQLVHDPDVRVLFTVRGVSDLREFDEAEVLEAYGVPADRYAEFAILRGDPSDGLPGVRGVGEKTARTLVQAYPDMDAMLADAARDDPAPGPLRGSASLRSKLLEASGYLAAMRRLVPINDEAPLEEWTGAGDTDVLYELAEGNGLRGPVQRLQAALQSRPGGGSFATDG